MRIAICIALFASSVLNAQVPPKPDPPIALTPEAMVWTEGPSTLPPGSTMAVLEGSPKADGMFTMRLRIPAGSVIPPHWHPRQERVTILSGAVDLGFSATANLGITKRYAAGSFYVNPPRVMHFLYFPEATEMQLTGVGPWELQTTDISTPAETATATAVLRSITPLPGSEVTPSTTITAVVDYDIRGFKPSTYWLDFVFETTTPNKMIGVGFEVKANGERTHPNYVQTPTGTVSLTQNLGRVFSLPGLKQPVRLRVYVHQQKSDTTDRVVGMSDWIEFK